MHAKRCLPNLNSCPVYQVDFFFLQEHCAKGDLYQQILAQHELSEAFSAGHILGPLLHTLHRLHTRHCIVHRDIKPENVLLTGGGEVRLADFGTAIKQDVEVPFLPVGTLNFMAPEVLGSWALKGAVESPCTTPDMLTEAGLTPYNEKADIWSLGAMAYEMVTGQAPFYHEDMEQTRDLILGVSTMAMHHITFQISSVAFTP